MSNGTDKDKLTANSMLLKSRLYFLVALDTASGSTFFTYNFENQASEAEALGFIGEISDCLEDIEKEFGLIEDEEEIT